MIIKVCGMTDSGNISEVAAAGADWIGIIFYPKSPRYVSMTPTGAGIIPDRCDMSPITKDVVKVGVFVDETSQNIITRTVNFGLDAIQFHGSETPTMMRNLRLTIDPDIRPGITFIKAINICDASDIRKCKDYEDCTDYFLFDTGCNGAGGSGKQFDWSMIDSYDGNRPFLLSGGIGPDDAGRIAALRHSMMAGVDLNSRFETAPGMKDANSISRFISRLRQVEDK